MLPQKIFFKLGALRSLLRPYLYSNLYLDSMPLEYRARVFLERHSPCSGIAEPSLHRVPATGYGSKGVKKGHRTRQFEGGALKGKSLPRGGTCPWCLPVSAGYDKCQLSYLVMLGTSYSRYTCNCQVLKYHVHDV